jgi:hypothetical protein
VLNLSITSRKVIVFRPTGVVGLAVVRTTKKLGAKVVLIIQSIKKAILGLNTIKEKQGSFERVYTDLTKPDSVYNTIKTTRVKYAFIYLAYQIPNNSDNRCKEQPYL